jgi:hypothetical protein
MAKWLKRLGLGLTVAGLVLAGPGRAFGQSSGPVAPPADSLSSDPPVAPLSERQLNRIRQSLNQPSGLRLDERQLRFYLEIIARRPTFAEYVRGYDFINGPTKRGNPMSHQEFVQMVTPKEMYSQAGITASEQIQMAITNWIGQSLIRRALDELKDAKSEREVMAIRERIDRELEALTGGGRSRTQ